MFWRRPSRRSARLAAATAALATSALAIHPAVAAPAATDSAPRRIVSGWLPYWTASASLASVTSHGDLWRDASPFWYQATGATTIQRHPGAGDQATLSALWRRGILVVPTVTETLNAADMATLLADPAQRTAHVKTLVDLATLWEYDGIDLDYESMNFGGTAAQKAAVRDGFVLLVQELGKALDANQKILSVTVGARTAGTNWWPVHDYARIGKVADRFRIMAYDYSYAGGPAGAIAPLPWVEQVLSYAVTVVPRDKIQLGVPLYGYDWPKDPAAADGWGAATALSYTAGQALRSSVGATRQWSATDSAPYFTYAKDGVEHKVWYEDAESTTAKTRLVGKYRIQGVVMWAVGAEDTRQWSAIRNYAVRRSTTLTVRAPAVVARGAKVTVSGKLTAGAAVVKGESVALQRKDAGATAWKTVTTGATSSAGTVSFTATPSVNGSYRLHAPGSWAHLPTTSPAALTKVRFGVTAAFSDATVRRGVTTTLRGTVAPGRAGTSVVAQRLVEGTWTKVATKKVGAGGTYAFSIRVTRPGQYTYRVWVPATTLNAATTSPRRGLRVS